MKINYITSSSHLVHFYPNESLLCDQVANYIRPCLRQNDAVIMITSSSNYDIIARKLTEYGYDIEKTEALGQLIFLNANELLDHLLVKNMPDALRFNNLFGPLLDKMTLRHTQITAYGEMVNLLSKDNNLLAAFSLEKLWNDLAKKHTFNLMCSYCTSYFDAASQASTFHEIGCVHSGLFPANHSKFN